MWRAFAYLCIVHLNRQTSLYLFFRCFAAYFHWLYRIHCVWLEIVEKKCMKLLVVCISMKSNNDTTVNKKQHVKTNGSSERKIKVNSHTSSKKTRIYLNKLCALRLEFVRCSMAGLKWKILWNSAHFHKKKLRCRVCFSPKIRIE